jgi:DNA primase
VRALAAERGIAVPETGGREAAEPGRVERIHQSLAFAHSFFVRELAGPDGAEARAYLRRRGYDEAATRRFGLGYAPGGWDRLIRAAEVAKIPVRALDDAGLVVPKEGGGQYDRFRNRLIFPIADLRGRPVTFAGRALAEGDNPKYLNGPETLVFHKSQTLFALDRARDAIRRTGEALLMEGYTDVLMAHLCGIDRAVAGMGTAFTDRQAALLARFAKRVVLVYDADAAGRTAAERAADLLLEQGLEVRVADLPEGRDIDEVLLEEGTGAVEAILRRARDLLSFKVQAAASRHDSQTPSGRARAAEEVVATIVRVPSLIERDQLLRQFSERLGGPDTEAVLRREAARVLRPSGRGGLRPDRRAEAAAGGSLAEAAGRARDATLRRSEAVLIAAALAHEALRPLIYRSVGSEDFTVPVLQRLYNALRDMEEAGRPYDARTVAASLASDAEASAALADLPDDPTLEELVPSQIEYLERRRRESRRARELVEGLYEASAAHHPTLPDALPRDPGSSAPPRPPTESPLPTESTPEPHG